jgi:two-component system, NtrC family, sensor kinase
MFQVSAACDRSGWRILAPAGASGSSEGKTAGTLSDDGKESAPRLLPRVLIVDDSPSIHEDFRKILVPQTGCTPAGLHALETELFGGDHPNLVVDPAFDLDCASDGGEGVALVSRAVADRRPYALAFVDLRMPPGWSGVETIGHIWEVDPRVQIVLCTAYPDRSWEAGVSAFGGFGRVLLMEKPFASADVRRVASEMTARWLRGLDRVGNTGSGG